MKKHTIFMMVFIMVFLCMSSQAQDLLSPSPGKSLLYFVRSNGTGALINFKYFHHDLYLGKFSGMNYFIYETDPGEHIFWVGAENREFLEATLEADQVYMIEVRPTMGALKAAVKVFPIDPNDTKTVNRIQKILDKKPPIALDSETFSDEGESLSFYIENGMKKYQTDKTNAKPFRALTPDYSFTKITTQP
ncbi:hypothetical protein GCM10009119_26600 [Algoriphagus jejuensis]|uniref:DUF2846 domain-containing protein n=1 Tax=Algoriphagus jejuensis TaxID=419934 RepID=A0ABP3YED5_9BACT